MLAAVLVIYVSILFGLALWARSKGEGADDFLVAGRRLSLPLSLGTIIATWVGAGTILATVDEVRADGFAGIGLEPLGPGVCLLIVGLFFAKPLWQARIYTANDLYRQKFGRRAEWVSTLFAVGYLPWIAAVMLGAAGILTTFFGMEQWQGIILVALIALGYTLLGGMWSVTLTDAFQVVLVVIGLIAFCWVTASTIGDGNVPDGVLGAWHSLKPEERTLIPLASLQESLSWIGLFLSGSLGLVASQDLLQRVFSARSARVASLSCCLAGGIYILVGSLPVFLGLASRLVLGQEATEHIASTMATLVLNPGMQIAFVVSLASAILSTLDSAILAPSTVIAQNLVRPMVGERVSVVALTRLAIVFVTIAGVGFAFSGDQAFALLESAYSSGLALFVVLLFAVHGKKPTTGAPAIAVMSLGLMVWGLEWVSGWQGLSAMGMPVSDPEQVVFPVPVVSLTGCFLVYWITDKVFSLTQ